MKPLVAPAVMRAEIERRKKKRIRDAAPDILAALQLFIAIMDKFGSWDEGCFYYSGRSASELQEPINDARAAIAKALGETE